MCKMEMKIACDPFCKHKTIQFTTIFNEHAKCKKMFRTLSMSCVQVLFYVELFLAIGRVLNQLSFGDKTSNELLTRRREKEKPEGGRKKNNNNNNNI